MRVRALYVSKTFAIGSRDAVEYAILDERDLTEHDIALLSAEPRNGLKRFADPAKGWLDVAAWEVRDRLLIISGVPRMAATAPILRLDQVRVEKEIPIQKIVETLLKRGEELAKKAEESEEASFTDEDITVNIDGLEFQIVTVKPPTSAADLQESLLNIYVSKVTAARKRAFVAAPAFIEIVSAGQWYATTLPRVLKFAKQNPDAVVQMGIIDPVGFKAPYVIVQGMEPPDLGTITDQRANVEWLDRILKVGARPTGGVGIATGAAEEVSPF